MDNNDCIVDQELIQELCLYRDAYAALSPEEKASLSGDKTSFISVTVKALSTLLKSANRFAIINRQVRGRDASTALSQKENTSPGSDETFTSAKALSAFLKNLNPHATTYGQARELAKLYHATRTIPAASKVLKEFETRKLNYSITQSMTSLGTNITGRVDQFLEQKDKSDVQSASKAFFLDDSRTNRLGLALLHHVIKGNQDTVVQILRRYPELLLFRGDVVDYSGRKFKNVTAMDLVIWALDVRHMAPAMLKCLADNEDGDDYSQAYAPELQRQFDSVVQDGGGVNYTIGCGLLNMSQDPERVLPGQTVEEKNAELNRKLDRHDGLIQYDDKIFYFHNLQNPKKLVEITDAAGLAALQGLMSNKARPLKIDQVQITHNDSELQMIKQYIPESRHIFKEKHYNITPFTDALDEYKRRCNPMSTWSERQREVYWCTTIGLEQHYLPAHIAQHCCNLSGLSTPYARKTPPPPTFKDNVLARGLMFYNSAPTKGAEREAWWPSSRVSDSKGLGLDLAVGQVCSELNGQPMIFYGGGVRGSERQEFNAARLTSLCDVRKSDVAELQQRLHLLQKPDEDSASVGCAIQ